METLSWINPVSWVNQYPSGLMEIDNQGVVTVPPANAHQTIGQTAHKRALDIINTGSTHKLPPIRFETFSNQNSKKKENMQLQLFELILFIIIFAFIWWR